MNNLNLQVIIRSDRLLVTRGIEYKDLSRLGNVSPTIITGLWVANGARLKEFINEAAEDYHRRMLNEWRENDLR